MNTLNVGQWVKRYPDCGDDAMRALEKVNEDVIGRTLPDAIKAMPFGDEECICLKELRVPIVVDTTHSTRSQSRAWSRAFIQQLDRILRSGEGVVRYRTRTHAHIACAENVVRGDLAELWAWRRLGLIDTGGTASEAGVLDAWCRGSRQRGADQLAMWRYLLTSPTLVLLCLRLNRGQWRLHLDSLSALLRSKLIEYLPASSNEVQIQASPEPEHVFAEPDREGSFASLPFPLHDVNFLTALRQSNPAAREALILIAIAVTEPGLLHNGSAASKLRVERMQRLLRQAASGYRTTSDVSRTGTKIPRASESTEGTTDVPGRAFQPDTYGERRVKDTALASILRDLPDEPHPRPDVQAGPEPLVTRHGGLFYLFNVIQQCPEFVTELLDDPVFQTRLTRWTWYWLARFVLDTGDAHTAALVFSGADEKQDRRSLLDPQPDDEQTGCLKRFAERVLERWQRLLVYAGGEPDLDVREHLSVNAVVTLEAAWTKVTYSLEDVDILVRRAGLDRNPDFLPWLGRVVRFVYA